MAELKTKLNEMSVDAFLDSVEDEQQRKDCRAIMSLMQSITHAKPDMWGTNIIGFERYPYKYASGKEGIWFKVGFSPRKQNITLYLMAGFEQFPDQMQKLGKYKTGKSCLYIRRLSDVDASVLKTLITENLRAMKVD